MTFQKILNAFLTVFCLTTSANALTTTQANPIPADLLNSVQWEIQKQMSFTSKNETTSLLWTPKTIELQNMTAESQPTLNPYAPGETFYRLLYDVGLGHNMDTQVIYWRQCSVTISFVGQTWGEPQVDCDISSPLR